MPNEEVVRRLDVIASILKVAHRDDIARAREAIRNKPAKAALLDGASDWKAGGQLVRAVARKVNKSERAVQRYVGELLDLGVLERWGATKSIQYRATGVI